MTNVYVTQAVATERIRQLRVEAEHDRRRQLARSVRVRTARPALRVQAIWQLAFSSPRRFRSFVLAGQLGSGYQAGPC